MNEDPQNPQDELSQDDLDSVAGGCKPGEPLIRLPIEREPITIQPISEPIVLTTFPT